MNKLKEALLNFMRAVKAAARTPVKPPEPPRPAGPYAILVRPDGEPIERITAPVGSLIDLHLRVWDLPPLPTEFEWRSNGAGEFLDRDGSAYNRWFRVEGPSRIWVRIDWVTGGYMTPIVDVIPAAPADESSAAA